MNLDDTRCPDCTSTLEEVSTTQIRCPTCERLFPVLDGVPALYPSRLDAITSAEIAYWDSRGDHERTTLSQSYETNHLEADRWGLYGYKDWLEGLPIESRVLELGCGTNPKSLFLSRFRDLADVTVSDLSIAQLAANRDLCRSLGLENRVRHIAADMARLPFRNEVFDVVLVHAALHHVPNVDEAVAEMARCLRPSGIIIIGHEPNQPMIRLVRGIAARSGLGEKNQADCYSVADDELEGLRPEHIKSILEGNGVSVKRVDRQWFLMALIHPMPLMVQRATGKHIKLPGPLVSLTVASDRVIARIPVINRFSFHFSVIGVKHTRSEPAA
jgi:SAM-dependent methyltransferase